MLRYIAMIAVAFMLPGSQFALLGEKADKEKPAEMKDKDILKEVKQWNSARFVAPPTKFKQGHVKPRQLDPKTLANTKTGFMVSLPSKAPIPTPTYYKKKLYVSGGFHSKQFYCLDAMTGKLVWGVDLDDDGPSAAVCEDDVVVFNTESCTIFALDARTGKHLWSYWLGDPLTSTPAIANGVVFTSYPARGRGIQMQNIAPNGAQQQEQLKQAKPGAKPNGKPAPPCSHVLAAFSLKTGKILWQRWIDSDVMSAPVAIEKDLYITSFAGVVYKFNQTDGKILSAVKTRATSAPVVVADSIYLTRRTDDGKKQAKEAIAALSRTDQKEKYRANNKDAVYIDRRVQAQSKLKNEGEKLDAGNGFGNGAPAAANAQAGNWNIGQGNVFTLQGFQGSRILHYEGKNFNCMGDELICTDPPSGKNLWSFKIKGDLKKEGGFLAAPPAAAGGMLFLVTLKGNVLQVDPKAGKIVKTYKVGHPVRFQPVVEAGKIFVGTQDGKIVCIDTGNPKFTGWSCWGANAAHTSLLKAK